MRSFRRHLTSQHSNAQPSLNDDIPANNCDVTESLSNIQNPISSGLFDCSTNILELYSFHDELSEDTLKTAHDTLKKSAATLALSLYGDASINRKTAQNILENVEMHITQVIGEIFKN